MLSRHGDMMNVWGGTENWGTAVGALGSCGGGVAAGKPA